MSRQLCLTHPEVDYKTAWGCPSCVKELREENRKLINQMNWYQIRCVLLQKAQASMRDPERKIVCDILANGKIQPPTKE